MYGVCFIIFYFSTQKSWKEQSGGCSSLALAGVCLTFSLLMVTVASATLRATGVQSSLLEEPIRLSIAPFSMSMPGAEDVKNKVKFKSHLKLDYQHQVQLQHHHHPRTWCLFVRLTYWSGHRQHPKVEHLKLLNQLCLWCGELCWGEATHTFNWCL